LGNAILTRTSGARQIVKLAPRLWLFGLLAGIIFSWPLLLHGRPTYFPDTPTYYKGGRVAIDYAVTAAKRITGTGTGAAASSPAQHTAPSEGGAAATDKVASQARGLRSITYSLLTYLLSAPGISLIGLALAQALLSGLMTVVTLEAFAERQVSFHLAAAIALGFAIATPVAFVSIFAMPDIFAGLMIPAIILPATARTELSLGVKLFLASVGGFAVSAHASHPPVAAGLTVLALGWVMWEGRRGRMRRYAWLWIVAPLALGVAGTMAVNRIGVGSASIVAKRYPLTLARSVADGPARWYLEANCPKMHYMVCKFFPGKIPRTVDDFLWAKTGLEKRATPAEMDQIRIEEPVIVLAAARAYPLTEAYGLARNIIRQLYHFWPALTFGTEPIRDSSGFIELRETSKARAAGPQWLGYGMEATIALSAAFLAFLYGRLARHERAALLLLILALLGNAVVCVAFSGVSDRYQARVIWLVPLFAVGFGLRIYRRSRQRAA
jgi:hypothetical protein